MEEPNLDSFPHYSVRVILQIWSAASHQPWIVRHLAPNRSVLPLTLCQDPNLIFLELYAVPKYVEMTYQEMPTAGNLEYKGIDRLPILNSSIKDSVRLSPLDQSRSSHHFALSLSRRLIKN